MQRLGGNLLIGCCLLALAACTEATPPPPPTPAPVVVETGGTALSLGGLGSEVGGEPVVTVVTAATAASVAASAEAAAVVYAPGAAIVARGVVRIYPEADPRAQAMSEYPAAATFVVIEPGADYAGYPVAVNEVRWYRVRAADGLVGWVMADGVEAQAE